MEADEIQRIITEIDYRGNREINYTEFLAATVSVQKFLTDKDMKALFRQFDVDSTGKLSRENIAEAMS